LYEIAINLYAYKYIKTCPLHVVYRGQGRRGFPFDVRTLAQPAGYGLRVSNSLATKIAVDNFFFRHFQILGYDVHLLQSIPKIVHPDAFGAKSSPKYAAIFKRTIF
jgi:hypothetical protein